MVDTLGPLEILYARHDAMAAGRARGDSTAVHAASYRPIGKRFN